MGNHDTQLVELIVECHEDKAATLRRYGRLKYFLPSIEAYVMEVPTRHVKKLKRLKSVSAVYPATPLKTQINQAKAFIGADQARGNLTGAGVGIAILDTGISPVADFTQPTPRLAAFRDFVNNRQGFYDDNGHGTHLP